MGPLLLILLLILLLPAALGSESAGLNFTVAFPEIIARYHPDRPMNTVKLNALYGNTKVTIRSLPAGNSSDVQMEAQETHQYSVEKSLELWRANISTQLLQISSDKNITVHVVFMKNNSVQTTVVTPTGKLGTEYPVPPAPPIPEISPAHTRPSIERRPFKLVIINADRENVVTVGDGPPFVLHPHQVAQVQVPYQEAQQAQQTQQTMEAQQPVAVLFTHLCATRLNCTCGQLMAALPAAPDQEHTFYIPPLLALGAEEQTSVLLSQLHQTQSFNPKSPLVKTRGSAILFRPGLLLPLVAEAHFASCVVVNPVAEATNRVVILVHRDQTEGVHLHRTPLESHWEPLETTQYVSTSVDIMANTVIWHTSSKMAVYLVGSKGGAPFGNPAAIISKHPDFRGCVLTPEVVEIGEKAAGWRESVKFCKDKDLELLSFPLVQHQRQIYNQILQLKDERPADVWIGLRQSSRTGQWYWLNQDPVSHTNWAEPGSEAGGQCALMSLQSSQFGWSHAHCCSHARPVCYRSPVFHLRL